MLRANSEIGPYTLIKRLGKGAFGVVWLAEKRTAIATSQVAIKIALDEEQDLNAIKQEASIWSQIGGHPNILPIIEANIYDGQVVIVSEYVPDGSLESWLKLNGGKAPTVEQAINITLGILSGLEYLHSKKVLHQDLKPANILLQGETPRLVDFGLAKILEREVSESDLSDTYRVLYKSPEVFEGKEKVLQTDLWAVGVIFYQLLTGNLPFPAKNHFSLMLAIFTKDPEPLPENLKQFTPIITKALQRNPDERYLSASLMKTALQNVLKPTKKNTILASNVEIGPYTLIKQLGKGAFGVVWLAEKRTAIATSQVAIKIALDEEQDLNSIKQEASIWSQIGGHPNVLPMIEANIYDGQVVIVSEYAPDGSLESWLKMNSRKAPTIEQAINITLGVLSGLEHLHSKKVLHRDLKPANILLQGETPRLADFGLSRILKTTSQTNADGTMAGGTPAYMSPEAFDGKKVLQTDIWAAGVIFYQLLTGSLPFPSKDHAGLIGAIFTKDPEPLPENLKQFTPIITKALQRNPDERYLSASLMKTALQNVLKPTSELIVKKKIILAPNVEIGPYTLVKLLGRGQFGMVWLAEKRTTFATTQVALKLPIGEDTDLEVIKQEASIWASVGTHPNIVPILEANIYDGQIVIACEYVTDGTLADYLAANSGKAASLSSAIAITKGILSGLEHLHSKKIVHRDLKPANILLQGEIPRLADFGLARILKTYHSGIVAGSPAYMSPEAFYGERFEQTDLWAVGVIFYQMLVGKMPFPQQNINALINAITLDPPESLPSNISKELQEIINRALEKEPRHRYKSAKEMKMVLEINGNPIKPMPKVELITEPIQPSETTKPTPLENVLTNQVNSQTKQITINSFHEYSVEEPPVISSNIGLTDTQQSTTNIGNISSERMGVETVVAIISANFLGLFSGHILGFIIDFLSLGDFIISCFTLGSKLWVGAIFLVVVFVLLLSSVIGFYAPFIILETIGFSSSLNGKITHKYQNFSCMPTIKKAMYSVLVLPIGISSAIFYFFMAQEAIDQIVRENHKLADWMVVIGLIISISWSLVGFISGIIAFSYFFSYCQDQKKAGKD